ncbi:MAG TPA: hypothetical protein VMV41_00150 [Cellulomonadaceae bacterium]|nr:hypothetical protein [Cellulomonadaceae bacterium]
MLILAGGGMSIAGALVVFGALTGRLAAMAAAVFKPADLSTGYYVRPGAVDPLAPPGTVQPGNGGAQPNGLGGYLGGLTAGTNPYPQPVPAPQVAPEPAAPAQQLPPLPGTQKSVPGGALQSLAGILTGATR